jgi:hypothetical protein
MITGGTFDSDPIHTPLDVRMPLHVVESACAGDVSSAMARSMIRFMRARSTYDRMEAAGMVGHTEVARLIDPEMET